MKLYIADLHFFQSNFENDLDKRGFSDVKSMNDYMLDQWNNKVRGGDQVIVLGDLFDSKIPQEVNGILNRLKGKICLIEGNHDVRWLKKEGVNLNRFEWIKPYAEVTDGKSIVVLSHYPVFCYNHQYLLNTDKSPRSYMLYGHVHNTSDEVLVNHFIEITKKTTLQRKGETHTIPCNMINCFCKFSDYTPLSLKEWIKNDQKRRENARTLENPIITDTL